MDDLRLDRSLDWLASKCARGEAKKIAALREQGESKTSANKAYSAGTKNKSARGAAASLILPSSSPVRGFEDCQWQKKRVNPTTSNSFSGKVDEKEGEKKIRAVWVEDRKIKLFAWAVKRLREEGIIVVHLPDLDLVLKTLGNSKELPDDPEATPKASRVMTSAARIVHRDVHVLPPIARDPNLPSSWTRQHAENLRQSDARLEESYALITPASLLFLIEPIALRHQPHRLASRAQNTDGGTTSTDEIWTALTRDDMWKYVRRGDVAEALKLLEGRV